MNTNQNSDQNPQDLEKKVQNSSTSSDNKEQSRDTFEEKVKDNLRDARNSKRTDLYDYTNYTKEQIITYILLFLGLLLLFINNMLGGLIIGVVAGYYFANDIVYYLRNFGEVFSGNDHLRYITLTAVLLGLFIAAPGIFIGAAIVAAFRQVIEGGKSSK